MITQCISAVCALGVVFLAILITTRAIALDDALKVIGKALLVIMVVYIALCVLAPPLRVAVMAFVDLLKLVVRWLVVAVFVVVPVTLFIRALVSRFIARSNTNSARDRGDV
jgi:hypothetical protein